MTCFKLISILKDCFILPGTDRRLITSLSGPKSTETLRETRIDSSSSNNTGNYSKFKPQQQDSLDDVPDFASNQDVSLLILLLSISLPLSISVVLLLTDIIQI